MSQTIDTKVVEMQFDNSKFEKNIEVSLNSLKYLNKNIDEAGKNRNSLDGLASAGDRVGISFDNMNMKSRISLNMMDLIAGVGTKAFNSISDAVAGFAMNMAQSLSGMQAMRDGFNEYELKMGSVQTILAGAKIKDPLTGKYIKEDARRLEIVNQELEKLNAYSDKTIYSFKDMTSNIGKFTNAGVDLKSSVEAIQGVANVAAISGANANEASRAMYNFSQALSSGAVKLIDWKSIENANMATQGFKEQLLATAEVMGTVEKKGKMYVSTTKDANGKVSEAFNTTKMFNDSLSHQWMTTEVLTQTLRNYSTDVRDMSDNDLEKYRQSLLKLGYTTKQVDSIIETSRKAFEAATEVKTFSQMIDTLKESLGSGWAQTFEIIIGDFNEAKQLFTGLNNAIDSILSPIGNARNAILKVWKADGGRDAMLNAFANLYHAVQNLFDPIKQLWKALTPNTSHTGKALATIFKWIEKLTFVVRKGALVIGKAIRIVLAPIIFLGNLVGKGLVKLVGFIRFAFKKIVKFFQPVKNVIKAFSSAISEVFNNKVITGIRKFGDHISKSFGNLQKRIKESESIRKLVDAFRSFRDLVQELFGRVITRAHGAANNLKLYLEKIYDALAPLISSTIKKFIKTLSDFILPKLEKVVIRVSDAFKSLGDRIKKIDFTKTKLYKSLTNIRKKLDEFLNSKTLKGSGNDTVTSLSERFKKLKTSIESIKMPKGLSEVFDNIKNFIKGVFGADSITEDDDKSLVDSIASEDSEKKLTLFQRFIDSISGSLDMFRNAIDKAQGAFKTFIDFIVSNTPKALKAFYNFLAGDDGVLQLEDLVDVIYTVSDAFSVLLTGMGFQKLGNAAEGFSDAFGEITKAFTTFIKRVSNKVMMSSLRDFAIAIGVMAAAMFVLAQIPAEKLIIVSWAIIAVGYGLYQFFSLLSTGTMDLIKVMGNFSISAILVAVAVAMLGVAASIGMLVMALKAFPKVIESYNDLGDKFRTGMDRVKEVLKEIFEYLSNLVAAKYGFRGAIALLGLVKSLDMIRKTIVKYAGSKTGKAMEDGLARIQGVLEVLGRFLNSVSVSTVNVVNIGANFNTVGIAGMIWALGKMITDISVPLKRLSKFTPSQFDTALDSLKKILNGITGFIVTSSIVSGITNTGLRKWLGIAGTVTLLGATISSIVESISTLASIHFRNAEGLDKAIKAISGIFVEFTLMLGVIGVANPTASLGTLFGMSVAIGVLTACVVAMVPLAETHPEALQNAVGSVGALMLAMGGALWLAGQAAGKTTIGDIARLVGMTLAMVLLTSMIRRLAKRTDPDSILGAGIAISVAMISMAGAMRILGKAKIPTSVLIGLGLLAAAIWGVAFAIKFFKSSAGGMAEGTKQVEDGVKEVEGVAEEGTKHMEAMISNVAPQFMKDFSEKIITGIREAMANFDLGTWFREKIEILKADAKNWAQDFIDIGTNLMEGIATALENPENISRIKDVMKSLGKAILDAFKMFFGINSPSTVMAEQGGFILDGLVQGLMEYPAKLAGWVKGVGTWILDGIKGFFGGAKEKGQQLLETLGNGIQNGKNFVVKKASAVGKLVLNGAAKVKDWGKRAGQAVSAYASKISHGAKSAKAAAGKIASNVIKSVSNVAKDLAKFGMNAAANFSSRLSSGSKKAKAAAHALITAAKNAFNNIKSSFETYGTWAAEGFKNGIHNLISKVADKAREMVKRAKEAAKSEQNSSSPSKDFMEFGNWAAEGYAIGLSNRNSSSLIRRNARRMVGIAKNAVAGEGLGVGSLAMDSSPAMRSLALAMSQISDTIDENMDTSPMIRPVVDMNNVNRSAALISSIFGNERMTAGIDIAGSASKDFEQVRKKDEYMSSSINRLASRIGSMTDAMNSRSLNVINNIDGSADPAAFADELVRSFKLNARTL